MRISFKELFKKIKGLTTKNRQPKKDGQITVSSEINIVPVGEIKALVDNSPTSKSNFDNKQRSNEIFISFERPIIIKKPSPKAPQKIRGLKPLSHHSKKLWGNKDPVESEND